MWANQTNIEGTKHSFVKSIIKMFSNSFVHARGDQFFYGGMLLDHPVVTCFAYKCSLFQNTHN